MGFFINDDFNRANSNTVGGGWTETEANAADLSILSNELKLAYTAGSGASPILYRSQGTIALPATLAFKISPGTDTRAVYALLYADNSTTGAGGGNGLGIRFPMNDSSANSSSIVIPGNASYATFTIDTTSVKYIWIDYSDGGGGTIDLNVYVSTTSTKPGSATITRTGLSTPANTYCKFSIDGGASSNVGLVDDVTLSYVQALTATVTETITVSDTISAVRGKVASILDTLAITDTISAVRGKVASVLDTLSISDVISAVREQLWELRTRPSAPSWTVTGDSPSNSWLSHDNWHYVYTGFKTPLNDGWTYTVGATITPGNFVETCSNGIYRTVGSGTSASHDFRLDYTFPQIGTIDFTSGVTVEWEAQYLLSATGTPQSNFHIGDTNELIRVLFVNSNITIRGTNNSVIYTDSATDKTTYHKYKLVILGTAVDYYVDDVLITSVTTVGTGAITNYARIFHRCAFANSTYDVSYKYIRVRRGVTSTPITSWTTR